MVSNRSSENCSPQVKNAIVCIKQSQIKFFDSDNTVGILQLLHSQLNMNIP